MRRPRPLRERLTHPSRFAMALAAIAVLALALRVVYILAIFPEDRMGGDAIEFHWLARLLAEGYGFVQPAPLVEVGVGPGGASELVLDPTGQVVDTADKPPLYPFILALGSLIDPADYTIQRLISAVLGTGTVIVGGLIARRLGSVTIGVVAAAILALYPPLWLADGSLRSETLYALLIAGALLAALRFLDRPDWRRAAWLGALIGLSSLARGEALVLIVPALVVIAVKGRPRVPWRALLAGALAFALLVTPWLARNWAVFDRPTAITSNDGGLFYGANCDRAYNGPLLGAWACFPPHEPGENEAEISARARDLGLEYAAEHADRLPVVIGARILRVWDFWHFPAGDAEFEAEISGREPTLQHVASWTFYLLVPFAIAGAWLLRRRPLELAILLTPVALVTFIAAFGYGTVRFRAPAEVPLVVLASVALVRAAGALRARHGAAEPSAAQSGA